MFNYIERLRKKPRDARMRIAFLCAVVVTGVIAFIWILSLPSRLGVLSDGAREPGGLNSVFGETASSVRDVVRGAEVFGDAPSGQHNTGTVQDAINGSSTRERATSSRRVLIATSTSETTAQ